MGFNIFVERQRNQALVASDLRRPEEVVSRLGAVQAQDYPGARWALGLRAPGLQDDAVEEAFNAGRILRTHVLRPTWHFVAPADIRWMLALSGPRVHAMSASYLERLELDPRTLTKARRTIERALRGGKHLTRAELGSALTRAGIASPGDRLAMIVMHAELEALVCSGPIRGKQFTYALLEERVPPRKEIDRDAALEALARRYFSSHGPATVRDFVWWSGLTVRDAKAGLEAIADIVQKETIGERTYWFVPRERSKNPASSPLYLLPNYDEYLVAYRDRGNPHAPPKASTSPVGFDVFGHFVVSGGAVLGTWRRTHQKDHTQLAIVLHQALTPSESRALDAATRRFGTFLNRNVIVSRNLRTREPANR
jgi:hypothetical protein